MGFISSFFLISSVLPSRLTVPDVEYLTTFGFVLISKLKLSLTVSPLLFCSSILAFTSKKSCAVEEWPSVFSA